MPEIQHYTGDDLDAMNHLVDLPGFRLFRERIAIELLRKRRDLEGYSEPDTTNRLRGSIAALAMVLDLAEIIRDDIKKDIKEHPDGE
jgi:hypothetical protein